MNPVLSFALLPLTSLQQRLQSTGMPSRRCFQSCWLSALSWGLLGLLPCPHAWSLEVGQTAPAYQARSSNASLLTSAQERGKVVLVHFWATWCVPCRTEMPALERYYQKHHAEGLDILAVSMDDAQDLPKMRQMMSTYSYPAFWYQNSDFKSFGRIWRIPLTFVIDRSGILRQDSWDGGDEGLDETALETVLTPLLAEP